MVKENSSQIDHPSHYNSPTRRCECIEAMTEIFGQEKVNIFAQLSQFKYVWRKGLKKGESLDKDLRKAQWYQDYVMNHKDPRSHVEIQTTELWTIDEMLNVIDKHFSITDAETELLNEKQSNNKNDK